MLTGAPCVAATDAHGRVLRYLRVSVTDRCNLRCGYCMPAEGISPLRRQDILRYEQVAAVVQAAVGLGVTSVRITGGEPLVRRGIANLVRLLAQIPGLADLSMTTNGILLPAAAQELADAGLQRVNISIDSLDPTEYAEITRGGDLRAALDGVHAALAAGLQPVKVNAVILDRDDLGPWIESFIALARRLPVHVRFIERMPVAECAPGEPAGAEVEHTLESLGAVKAPPTGARSPHRAALATSGGVAPEGAGPARYWRLPGSSGLIGLIAPMSAPFCDRCNRLRLTARGELRRCIFCAPDIDLRPWLTATLDPDGLAAALAQAWMTRPPGRGSPMPAAPGRTSMCQIGG
jgi:cyclic pyranopterin phosphate synthase